MIPGTITWEDPLTTVPAAGQATYRWTFTPDDTMHYLSASNTIHFSVDKATPPAHPPTRPSPPAARPWLTPR